MYNRALRKAYFNAMATIIQRWWRGFYSRKHIHNFYARKRYLQQVKERNQHIRAELHLQAERAIIMQRQVRNTASGMGRGTQFVVNPPGLVPSGHTPCLTNP